MTHRRGDPRTDREQLRSVSYGCGDLLADRQQLYRFVQPRREPIADWLYGLVGGPQALPAPILDIGAGNGQYLLALPGREAMGLDLSRGMLSGIRAAGFEGPLLEADAQAFPVATDSVGTVLANHMLYHVPDIALAVTEARRVLRADGLLLAITNSRDHMAELGAVLNEAVRRVCGQEFHLDRSGERFTLDEGGSMLATAFDSVERHARRAELIVPEVEPVMRYLASLVGLAPALPDGVDFAAVLAVAEAIVADLIGQHGRFLVHAHAGAFVCR